jgi:hypothetical protein
MSSVRLSHYTFKDSSRWANANWLFKCVYWQNMDSSHPCRNGTVSTVWLCSMMMCSCVAGPYMTCMSTCVSAVVETGGKLLCNSRNGEGRGVEGYWTRVTGVDQSTFVISGRVHRAHTMTSWNWNLFYCTNLIDIFFGMKMRKKYISFKSTIYF